MACGRPETLQRECDPIHRPPRIRNARYNWGQHSLLQAYKTMAPLKLRSRAICGQHCCACDLVHAHRAELISRKEHEMALCAAGIGAQGSLPLPVP